MRSACGLPRVSVNVPALQWPRSSLSKKFWKLNLENAELICPRIAHHPKVESSLLLVAPARSAKCFEALNLGLDVVGFQVEMHSFLESLGIISLLEKDTDFGIW